MEEYAGRILAHRYRLPLPPSDEYELVETRAFDTRSGQEVLVRQVPLPEVVDAELLDGNRVTPTAGRGGVAELPAVRRAIEAAQAAAAIPDHPRLDQVFDVFAEGDSLWIVSELVPARPLAALIADEPLSAYRAAEVASDVLTALRVLHAHGWTHRNITVRTVLVCDDGRVVLTGLAAGAAEEALCGYDPVPRAAFGAEEAGWGQNPTPGQYAAPGADAGTPAQVPGPLPLPHQGPTAGPYSAGGAGLPGAGLAVFAGPAAGPGADSGARFPTAGPDAGPQTGPDPDPVPPPAASYAPLVAPGYDTGPRYTDHITPERPDERPDERPELKAAARAGAIAAYRAGAQAAAARVTEQRKAVEEARPEGSNLPQGYSYPYGGPEAGATGSRAPWHGATPRRQALPPGPAQQASPDADPAPDPAPVPETPPEAGAELRPELRPEPYAPTGPGPSGRGEPYPEHQAEPYPAPQTQTHAQPSPDRGAEPYPAPQAQPGAPLPARLALPQGYRQADAPAGDEPPPAGSPEPGRALRSPAEPLRRAQAGGWGARPQPIPAPAPGRPAPGQPGPHAGPQVNPLRGPRPGWDGPRTGLDAERARQTRMAVVGAVTERWAPEQAGPVHGHWQLAAPVGPATDLWALGALLYRAVQGHAPYPEDSVAELVEMVCAEPPAFAEECGALRPIVESLLRQDPTERPDFEELRGWLRSLVRSAPEPEAGFGVLPMAESDPARLPVVRRRGELHGRHRNPAGPRRPRSLGRTLLVGVLALLAGAVAYAMLFMPRSPGTDGQAGAGPTPQKQSQGPSQTPAGTPESKPAPQTTTPPPAAPSVPAPPGYSIQQDPEHFQIAVPDGWDRNGINEAGQVRFTEGQFVLTVVPGRDKVQGNPDPQAYQKDKEPELNPYRSSTWSSVGDIKKTTVGRQLRVTARYTWIDGNGRNVFARNFVVALGGSYHVVIVTGPEDESGRVTEVFEKATASYRAGG